MPHYAANRHRKACTLPAGDMRRQVGVSHSCQTAVGFVDLENLVALFLMEQLCFLGEREVGLALSLKRMFVSKGLTSTAVLTTPPPLPDAQLRRLYKDLRRFAEDSMRNLTVTHEWMHLPFRKGVITHKAAAEKMSPLVEDLASLARHWGSKHFSQFPNEERRQQGAGMIEEICTRFLGDGMSDVSIEEIYCDVHASSHYARRYVAPRVIRKRPAMAPSGVPTSDQAVIGAQR